MSKSLNEIIYSVIEQLTGLNITDDQLQKFNIPLVGDKVKDFRAVLARQSITTNGFITDGFYQRDCCLTIECDSISCGGYTSTTKEYFIKLPELLSDKPGSIRYLGTDDWKNPASELSLNELQYLDGRRFTRHMFYYILLRDVTNGFLALLKNIPNPDIKYLCMWAPLFDPIQACDYNNDDVYPIPKDMVQKLEMLTFNHFKAAIQMPNDLINDANVLQPPMKEDKQQGQQQGGGDEGAD